MRSAFKFLAVLRFPTSDPQTPRSDIDRAQNLPEAGSVDMITFSYSLTMIPDWEKALQNAMRLLKPGGFLCVADFTVTNDHWWITRKFWPMIFNMDYVFPREAHIPTLKKMTETYDLQVSAGGFPYIPLLKSPYYYYIGRKPLQ